MTSAILFDNNLAVVCKIVCAELLSICLDFLLYALSRTVIGRFRAPLAYLDFNYEDKVLVVKTTFNNFSTSAKWQKYETPFGFRY